MWEKITAIGTIILIALTVVLVWLGFNRPSSVWIWLVLGITVVGLTVAAILNFKTAKLKHSPVAVERNNNAAFLRAECDKLRQENGKLHERILYFEDTSIKESDPKLYIEFQDDRGATMSGKPEDEAYFVLINRGKRIARIACLEPIRLKEHLIVFPKFGYSLPPTDSANIYPRITTPENRTPYSLDFFYVIFQEWNSFNNANLHELVIPMSATYQDAERSLFESTCELVFEVSQHLRVRTGGQTGGIKVITTRNHQFKKIAAVIG